MRYLLLVPVAAFVAAAGVIWFDLWPRHDEDA